MPKPARPGNDPDSPEPTRAKTEPQGGAPLLVDAEEAARLLSISRSTWYALVTSGRAPRGVRLGRCRRWSADDLRRWIEAGCPSRNRWEVQKRRG